MVFAGRSHARRSTPATCRSAWTGLPRSKGFRAARRSTQRRGLSFQDSLSCLHTVLDFVPDAFASSGSPSLHSLVNPEFYSHHGSTMTSCSECRSPGRPESLGFGYEIMYTTPLRLTGRSPAMVHVFETPGRLNRVPWRLPRCCSTIWRSNGLRATSGTFHTRIPFFEGKRNQQPHQPEKLKLKDNAKMGNGFRSQGNAEQVLQPY